MKVRLQKPVFVAISLALAVNSFVILLPSPHGNNQPVPPDAKQGGVKWEKGQTRQVVLA